MPRRKNNSSLDEVCSTKSKKKAPEEKSSTVLQYKFWLMKSEPESRIEKGIDVKFGLDDLEEKPNQTECWDGVRNYQARNFMRDQMKCGHKSFFYHSNCKEPGIAGIVERHGKPRMIRRFLYMPGKPKNGQEILIHAWKIFFRKIVKEAYPDHTQFDPKDLHYDKYSQTSAPRWWMVDVHFVRRLRRFIPLAELKQVHLDHKRSGGPLANMALFTRARLSVQPVTEDEWNYILSLEDTARPA